MPLTRTILEAPEHEFDNDDWEDDEELGTDGREVELDELDNIDEINNDYDDDEE